MNRYAAKIRPSSEQVKLKLQSLADLNLGNYQEKIGFFKNPAANKDELAKFGITEDEWKFQLTLEPKGLSNRQKDKMVEEFNKIYG